MRPYVCEYNAHRRFTTFCKIPLKSTVQSNESKMAFKLRSNYNCRTVLWRTSSNQQRANLVGGSSTWTESALLSVESTIANPCQTMQHYGSLSLGNYQNWNNRSGLVKSCEDRCNQWLGPDDRLRSSQVNQRPLHRAWKELGVVRRDWSCFADSVVCPTLPKIALGVKK